MRINNFFIVVKQHKLASIGIALAVLSVVFLPLFLSQTNSGAVYTVKRENIVNTVLVNGTYTIASQTPIISPTNGVITSLFVTNGAVVKKGDPLFHVESSATPDKQKAAYAAYLADQSTVAVDSATLYSLQSTMYAAWKKYTDLATNGTYQHGDGTPNTTNRVLTEFTTAQDDWLAAEAQYKNQQQVIAKDQAALASSLQAYNETQSVTVTAPIQGTIINLAAKIHDQVSASASVLMIADFRNPVLVSTVDQVNIPRLAVGQKAAIVFDALPNQAFPGSVEYIDAAGTKTQGTVDFSVYISVPSVPSDIKPNMTASITIETGRKESVLAVPNEAIIEKNNATFVRLAGKRAQDLTRVSVGLKGLTKTEIVSGLAAGDHIAVSQ